MIINNQFFRNWNSHALITAEFSLSHLLGLVVTTEDCSCLLSLELSNLDLALPVLVLTELFDAVITLLHEVEWLRHVFLVLHELLQLSALLVYVVDGLVGFLNIGLFLLEGCQLG